MVSLGSRRAGADAIEIAVDSVRSQIVLIDRLVLPAIQQLRLLDAPSEPGQPLVAFAEFGHFSHARYRHR